VRRMIIVLFTGLFFLFLNPAHAQIASIHASALPQETTILAALDDAQQLEPYSHSWTPNWKYSISKDDVANRLGKDMAFLVVALKNHPDNLGLFSRIYG